MDVDIRTAKIDGSKISSIKNLFNRCKWDWLPSDSEMLNAFKKSFRVFEVKVDDELIGFGRIISDGKIYGLLVDLMVDPEFRSKGIGKKLTNFIVRQCKEDGLRIIQLLSSREGRDLYLKSGFSQCPPESPGMIKFVAAKPE